MNLFTLFEVSIKLTNRGLENYEHVINSVFAYLKEIRESGVQEWVFEEIKTVNKLKFDNADKQKIMQYVLSLASRMQYFNLQDVLIEPYLFENFESQLIQKYLDSFQTSNLRIFLSSKSLEPLCDKIEPIYGTHFSWHPFDQNIIDNFSTPDISFAKTNKKLSLPPRNEFIPKSMQLYAKKEDELPKLPIQIADSVWFKQDNVFFTPKAQITLFIQFKDFFERETNNGGFISQIYEIN